MSQREIARGMNNYRRERVTVNLFCCSNSHPELYIERAGKSVDLDRFKALLRHCRQLNEMLVKDGAGSRAALHGHR